MDPDTAKISWQSGPVQGKADWRGADRPGAEQGCLPGERPGPGAASQLGCITAKLFCTKISSPHLKLGIPVGIGANNHELTIVPELYKSRTTSSKTCFFHSTTFLKVLHVCTCVSPLCYNRRMSLLISGCSHLCVGGRGLFERGLP